ncbi:MAG: hypothetical protein M1812_003991 [Candelaria pacifica]|nr:MAG: hypothetical protein M1812_003991 [Candelaria pacifica]
MFARSLRVQLPRYERAFSTTAAHNADFTHAIIGGGVVGLAIARKLAQRDGTSTALLEKHGSVGTETSSRNSEVIHAGLYYGPDSLKTKLCIKGKHMMYAFCAKHNIPHRNCKKWIVAQTQQQWEELVKIHKHAQAIGVPTRSVSLEEGRKREPDVKAEVGILESESTGIVDSHGLMTFLESDFQDKGGDLAFHSPVKHIETRNNGKDGYRIHFGEGENEASVTAEKLINSAGLYAVGISNMILPKHRHRIPYYCKGSYYSYSASTPKPRTLVYPAPQPGLGGLGTHLTLDMSGAMRFGPDVEWVDSPTDLTVNESQLGDAIEAISTYLPTVKREAIGLDYAGIRPKLAKGGAQAQEKGFSDFIIQKEEGFEGFINLLGIESPGLTSSLAIAEMVEGLLYDEVPKYLVDAKHESEGHGLLEKH